ncbi:hypothetical protein BST23_04190 [Mycolicibacterium elephantis]|uniref:Uncharacterized protein n=1 Tax=Mycolicibacterium elephantis TaxID=81858 RepID=A0A1X0D7G6_9MYCO|nr:hypothetical protein [Mycolicibacterium elephantis]ORA68288.1 hypothetical protein BST23_04190 [Mycolicibacterium elephantis]
MPTPTANDLSDYTGNTVNATQAAAVIGVVKASVNAWTRGVGFNDGEPNDELASVILSASARLIANTSGVVREEMGGFVVQFAPAVDGFTLREQAILNRYRETAK